VTKKVAKQKKEKRNCAKNRSDAEEKFLAYGFAREFKVRKISQKQQKTKREDRESDGIATRSKIETESLRKKEEGKNKKSEELSALPDTKGEYVALSRNRSALRGREPNRKGTRGWLAQSAAADTQKRKKKRRRK